MPLRTYQNVSTPYDMSDLHVGPFARAFDATYRDDRNILDSNALRLRAHFVVAFARWSLAAAGDFLSGGVSYAVMPKLLYDLLEFPTLGRRYHLVDPMIGFPDDCTDPAFVRRRLPSPNVSLHLKKLEDAFPLAIPSGLAFVHLDTGDAQAEASTLPYLLANLNRGGFLLIDGYGWEGECANLPRCRRRILDCGAAHRAGRDHGLANPAPSSPRPNRRAGHTRFRGQRLNC